MGMHNDPTSQKKPVEFSVFMRQVMMSLSSLILVSMHYNTEGKNQQG
jgi:hypothetical protein